MRIWILFLSLCWVPTLAAQDADIEAAEAALIEQATPKAEPAERVVEIETVRLLVGADPALKSALQDLGQLWADSHPEVIIDLELANAGQLEKLVREGRPYDMLLLPGVTMADRLAEGGLLVPGQRKLVARDRIAILGRTKETTPTAENWRQLLGKEWKSVAMGDPKLTSSGEQAAPIWEALNLPADGGPRRRVLPMDAMALALFREGQVDAVIGWRSQLGASREPSEVLIELSGKKDTPHFYVATRSQKAEHPKPAQEFMDFLVSETASEVWDKWGLAGE